MKISNKSIGTIIYIYEFTIPEMIEAIIIDTETDEYNELYYIAYSRKKCQQYNIYKKDFKKTWFFVKNQCEAMLNKQTGVTTTNRILYQYAFLNINKGEDLCRLKTEDVCPHKEFPVNEINFKNLFYGAENLVVCSSNRASTELDALLKFISSNVGFYKINEADTIYSTISNNYEIIFAYKKEKNAIHILEARCYIKVNSEYHRLYTFAKKISLYTVTPIKVELKSINGMHILMNHKSKAEFEKKTLKRKKYGK